LEDDCENDEDLENDGISVGEGESHDELQIEGCKSHESSSLSSSDHKLRLKQKSQTKIGITLKQSGKKELIKEKKYGSVTS
jgi:hypothetical protein